MDYNILFLYRLCLVTLEIAAFLVALGTIRYHNATFKLFFFDLLYIAISESAGFYILYGTNYRSVLGGVGNLYFPIEMTLIYLVSRRTMARNGTRHLVTAGYFAFIFVWLYNICRNGFFMFPTSTILFGSILGTIIFLGTLIEMIGSVRITRQPLFWMSIAMLVFYGCNIPYFGMLNYLAQKDSGILKQLAQILFFTNYIRYSLTIVAFLLLKKQSRLKPDLPTYHEQQ